MRRMLLVMLTLALTAGLVYSQVESGRLGKTTATRKVTFTVNTATVPDTIPVTGSQVQIRGESRKKPSPITWGNDAQNNMTAVGGDYWTKTLDLEVGDTIDYKYVIAYGSATGGGTGWEQNTDHPYAFPSTSNRAYIVADKDTVLELEFWNNKTAVQPQYWRPWAAHADSFFVVYFRVSTLPQILSGSYGYDQTKDTVGVRGGGKGPDLDWSPTSYLTKEAKAGNGDGYTVATPSSFWSGAMRLRKSAFNEGETVGYKFLIGSDWNRPNGTKADESFDRNFKVPVGKKDTTLKWVFFNGEQPLAGRANTDTIRIVYRTKLDQSIAAGGFAIGDSIWVRAGYGGTISSPVVPKVKLMSRLLGTTYELTDTLITKKGANLFYQYYLVKGSQDTRESYYNFNYKGESTSEAERREVTVPSNASLTTAFVINDTATSITKASRQPVFANQRKLARNVKVYYTVDLRPAIYQVMAGDTLNDIQGTFNITPALKDSILAYGVWMNGTAVDGWNNPGTTDWGFGLQGNLAKKLYDDGTNGDKTAGDSIFTRIVLTGPDTVIAGSTRDKVGQTFKFGIRGGDNEGGKGGFGNNHVENI
ncbi:MAG: Starch binding domain, partial [Bacteroidetes bacterium]|nr:Starch binding domain [Bacteroidota bacterium]